MRAISEGRFPFNSARKSVSATTGDSLSTSETDASPNVNATSRFRTPGSSPGSSGSNHVLSP
jgi:hypothetical protein